MSIEHTYTSSDKIITFLQLLLLTHESTVKKDINRDNYKIRITFSII